MPGPGDKDERNPLLIPADKHPARLLGCPKCKTNDYIGRNVQGVVTFTCAKCKNKWQGGLPQLPQDPTLPIPPQDPMDRPSVEFVRGKGGDIKELRRRVNPTPEFRKGLPIPEGEE